MPQQVYDSFRKHVAAGISKQAEWNKVEKSTNTRSLSLQHHSAEPCWTLSCQRAGLTPYPSSQAQQQVQQQALLQACLQELVKMPSQSSNVAKVSAGACAATSFGITLRLPQPRLRLRKKPMTNFEGQRLLGFCISAFECCYHNSCWYHSGLRTAGVAGCWHWHQQFRPHWSTGGSHCHKRSRDRAETHQCQSCY